VERADEDLEFLKSYAQGKTSTQISGTVRYRPDEPEDSGLREQGRTPMKDVLITISGGGRSYETKTDASGRFSILGPPPGAYKVSAQMAGYRTNWLDREIRLAPKGCAVAEVLMKVDRRVEGMIRMEDGRPAAGVLVDMVPVKPSSKRWENPVLVTLSDETGFYAIDGIPPGEYLLGINIKHTPTREQPYPPTYYPNTQQSNSATPVVFLAGDSVQSYDLILPEKLKVIRIKGHITDASGRPAKNAEVRIKEPGLYGQIETDILTIDSDGRFEIELCERVRYSGFAFSGLSGETVYSEPVEFVAGDAELRFVLNKTPDEFIQSSRRLAQR
jgi:hypothetical protein